MKAAEYEQEWQDNQIVSISCMFCNDFSEEGRAVEMRIRAAEHRTEFHPERKMKRRKNSRAWPVNRAEAFLSDEENADINRERIRRARLNGIEKELT